MFFRCANEPTDYQQTVHRWVSTLRRATKQCRWLANAFWPERVDRTPIILLPKTNNKLMIIVIIDKIKYISSLTLFTNWLFVILLTRRYSADWGVSEAPICTKMTAVKLWPGAAPNWSSWKGIRNGVSEYVGSVSSAPGAVFHTMPLRVGKSGRRSRIIWLY